MSSSTRSIDSGETEEEEDSIPLAQLLRKKRRIQKEEEIRQVVKKGSYANNQKTITLPLPASSYEVPVLQLENGSKGRKEGRCRSTKSNANIVHHLLSRSLYSSSQKNFICNTNRFRAFFFVFNSQLGGDTSSSRKRPAVVVDPSHANGSTTKKNNIACLSFHTYGTHVAVGCTEGTLRIYDCKTFLSLLYQVQLKKKPITNIQWNPDNLQEIAVAFAHCSATDNIILFNMELQITTPLVTNNTGANTNGHHHSHRSTITYNTLLFLPSNTTSTVSTTTQLVAGSTTGTLCVWSYRCYPCTTSTGQQQPIINASPSTWKLIYNKCTILPRGESIIDIKHITEGIIVIGGRLGSVVLLDLWKSQLPIFSSRQKVPTFLQQIRVPNQQQPLQRLWTHLTDSPNNTTTTKSSSRSRSMDDVSFLERITIWTMSFQGTITRIVFQPKGNNITSRSISSSNLKNNNNHNMPSSCYFEPSFTPFTTATSLPKNDHQTTTTKQTILTTCLGDLLLLHNPFMVLALLGQQEEEELTKTTTQKSANRWDPRVLSVPTQETNNNNNNSRYSLKIVLLNPQQQPHYGILPLSQEPCQIVVHPTNHSYAMVAYSNGSVELLSIGTNP